MPPSNCISNQAEQRLPLLPRTVELFGRQFVNGYFIPVPGVATDDSSKMMRALVQKALGPVLPTPVLEIVAGYSHRHPARLFAEGLYRELYKGRDKDPVQGAVQCQEEGVEGAACLLGVFGTGNTADIRGAALHARRGERKAVYAKFRPKSIAP